MTLQTRPATGVPPWPITLITGPEKTGKSYAAAAATADPRIGRCLWVGIGEDDPDEYGAIPDARIDIVIHDGTYRGILNALKDIAAEPAGDLPTLLVVDSMSRLWTLLQDMAQAEADDRAARKAAKYKQAAPEPGSSDISMDLWNRAAQRWGHVMDAVRAHAGPVALTARLNVVTVLDIQGRPTKDKDVKVEGHKSLPYDVTAIVELEGPGKAVLRGVRSLRFPLAADERQAFPDFTLPTLWERLGCFDRAGPRTHSRATAHVDWHAEIATAGHDRLRELWHAAADYPDADLIRESISQRVAELNDHEEMTEPTQEEL